jgi:glycosyltransferase involved in cell wall biosynthesis
VPRISVIMPAYNRAGCIGRAIDSVLAQDFADFELIVVDDGSKDATADSARGCKDPRVKVIELGENRGGNAARNAGIRAASAPLIGFLDSDDSYLPHKLSRVVAKFDAEPELDVLVDSFVKLCEPGAKRRQIERINRRISSTAEFRRRLFARELWKPTSAVTVRRDAAMRAGLFDEGVRRRQDLEFLIRLTEFANCAATDEILWVKSWSPDSISAGDQFVASTLELVQRHPEYLKERAYRVGLARDFARHLLQQLRRGRIRRAGSDAARISGSLGPLRGLKVLAEGIVEHAARKFRQRERALSKPTSSQEPSEPAKAQSRASGRF